MIGIYKVTNLINSKVYIGQSKDITHRLSKHKNCPFDKTDHSYNTPFYRAIRKYGLENFKFEIIEECSAKDLNKREKYWIKYYNSYLGFTDCNGYNLTLGGETSSFHVLSYDNVKEIQNLLLNTELNQTEIGNKFGVSQVTISQINRGLIWVNDELKYPLRERKYITNKRKTKEKIENNINLNYCMDCGIIISGSALRCKKCYELTRRKTERPSREELKQLIRTTPFTTIAKQFNVSDNAIRKWCDTYNLPRKSSEIKKYSDEEWEKI